MKLLEENIKQIIELCEKHKVKELYVFGSILREDFNPESDVDLIVDFQEMDPIDYGDNYYDFKFSLEDLLQREIDLLEDQAIKNPYLKDSIDSKKSLLYEG
jgi:hypothetical protein